MSFVWEAFLNLLNFVTISAVLKEESISSQTFGPWAILSLVPKYSCDRIFHFCYPFGMEGEKGYMMLDSDLWDKSMQSYRVRMRKWNNEKLGWKNQIKRNKTILFNKHIYWFTIKQLLTPLHYAWYKSCVVKLQ